MAALVVEVAEVEVVAAVEIEIIVAVSLVVEVPSQEVTSPMVASQVAVGRVVLEGPDTQIFRLATTSAPCISGGVPELFSARIRQLVHGRMYMLLALINEPVTNSAYIN